MMSNQEKSLEKGFYEANQWQLIWLKFRKHKLAKISLDEKFAISEKAWRMSTSGYSSMFVMLNDEVRVEDLLRGIIVVSGNDACVALAEGISGSEEEFVLLMNEKAKELEMNDTNFPPLNGVQHINGPLLVSSVLGNLDLSPIESFVNYDYQET